MAYQVCDGEWKYRAGSQAAAGNFGMAGGARGFRRLRRQRHYEKELEHPAHETGNLSGTIVA